MSIPCPDAQPQRCPVIDPVWDRQCVKDGTHEGVHQNDEIPGDRITWGTVAQVRAYERGEVNHA